MSRKTLVEHLDEIQFSQEALDLAHELSRYTATDEKGVVVLTAAALLLAGECPGRFGTPAKELDRLAEEFWALIYRMHAELEESLGSRPLLRVVGGTDMIGGAA